MSHEGSLEDSAPNEHFTETGVGDLNEDPPYEDKCRKCYNQGKGLVDGKTYESYVQEADYDRKSQEEVEILKCPKCGFTWST